MPGAAVVSLDSMRPKTVNRRYKQQDIVVTYIPATKEWQWMVTYVQTSKYSDRAATMNKAVKAAEKFIDETNVIRGVK